MLYYCKIRVVGQKQKMECRGDLQQLNSFLDQVISSTNSTTFNYYLELWEVEATPYTNLLNIEKISSYELFNWIKYIKENIIKKKEGQEQTKSIQDMA